MIIAEAEMAPADLLRLLGDLGRIELGKLVTIVSISRTKIGVSVEHSIAKELWAESIARGLLHEWGWGAKFFEHKPGPANGNGAPK